MTAAGSGEVLRVAPSPTLAADERVRRKIAMGVPVLHLAFGEAGLPVPASVREVLARAAGANGYGSVAGSAGAREAAAGYFTRRGLPTDADQIVFAPGSKPLLYALLRVLPGDVILPRPSWVSYAAQAALAGKRVFHAPIGEAGGVPAPAALEECIAAAFRGGGRPGVLVLTIPDNPTGTVAGEEAVREAAAIAEARELAIVSDEIYADLAYSGKAPSPARFAPERTFVTSGLSKSMALGGWRIGFARMPDSAFGVEVRRAVAGLASEVWSSLAAPMQAVAAHVLAEPADVCEHITRSRALHQATSRAAFELLVGAGIDCRPPGAAFYLYPDLERLRSRLGVDTADALAELLLDRFDVAVLSGAAFGDDPGALRFRIATSLLYGRNDAERRQALEADDPVRLPWIAEALDRLGSALASISV
jgi:aspartate aminotransferase